MKKKKHVHQHMYNLSNLKKKCMA